MRSIFTCLLGAAIAFLLVLGADRIGFFNYLDLLAAGWFRIENPAEVMPAGRLFVTLLLGIAAAWVAVDVARLGRRWAVLLVLVFLLATGSLVLSLYGILFSPAMPVVGVLLAGGVTMALCRVGPGAHRRRVEQAFGARLSKRALGSLCEGRAARLPAAAVRNAAVIVVESTNHADLIRNLPPEEFADLSRFYLSMVSDYLVEMGGFLLEASGTTVKVVFGAPMEETDPGESAGRAVLGLLARLDGLNLKADSRWHHLMEFRVGVATGEVVGGLFGNARTTAYTVAGGAVDLAARLAAACTAYGCRVLVCPATYEACDEEAEGRAVDLIRDAGGRQLEVYELLCAKGALSPERERSRDWFWKGVVFWRERKWDEAVEAFTKARIKGIPDPVLDFYLQRVESGRAGEAGSDAGAERSAAALVSAT